MLPEGTLHISSKGYVGVKPVVASAPWNSVVIDILGPFPSSARQNKYILVCMDRFTKWTECCALRNIRAESVAKAFVGLVVSRHGVPLECQSDFCFIQGGRASHWNEGNLFCHLFPTSK